MISSYLGEFFFALQGERNGMKTPMKYYTIRNQAGAESVEILLYGDIGEGGFFSEGIGAKQFAEDLKALGPIKNLDIRINSPGGSVFEGLAIYNTLERHSAKKIVTIDGLAASIASVIAMAGDWIVMAKSSLLMIHDPFGMVLGDADDMRKMAEGLDKIKTGLISAYQKKSKMSSQGIAKLMTNETWMTANEAVEWGFADEVTESVKMAAHFDLSKFKNVPKNILAKTERSITHMETEHEKFLQRQESEKTRTHGIAAMGLQFNLGKESLSAIEDGISLEDFRAQVMKKLQSQIVPIGPLDPEYRASYGSLARETGRQSGPFRSFGEQMISIYNAGIPGGRIDQRLNILNTTGLGTSIPSEGGWLVQTDFSIALLQRMEKTAILAPRCWHVPIGENADGVEMPTIDETSRATGSRWGGVQVYRRAEAATVTEKKPKFGSFELRLEDLMGICFTTNRQLKDAPSTGAIISRAFEEEMSFKLDDEIVRGTGVGECLGILNSAALVTVTKETGQAADTIVTENLIKMFSRMPARYRKTAAFFINQEIEPQLFTMGLIIGMGGSPIFMPAGGLSAEPYGTLFGRPLIPIEQASALGDKGDINFFCLNEYCLIEKGGLESTSSIHVKFLYDEMCFKFILRNNGAPTWKTPLVQFKGALPLSPFVTLEAR
jgi:HK97 family phage major capsid protein/ATP-dependent Clp endopeptidase proteolytic subunit ClpP